jgi:group I intron endonuclease
MITGIYRITSPSGKSYIGQSVNVEKRLSKYRNYGTTAQPAIHRSLLKYGFENHTVEVLQECSQSELNDYEEYYIDYYNTVSPNGYNLATGGGQSAHSDETKAKMSEICNAPEYKKRKAEAIKKYWADPKNRETINTPEFKKKKSEEIKKLWSTSEYREMMLGAINTPERRKKMSEASKNFWADPDQRKNGLKQLKKFGLILSSERKCLKNLKIVGLILSLGKKLLKLEIIQKLKRNTLKPVLRLELKR